ncbi:MAG: energy-coupling factor transporter transmembrane protein EcfT [Clostridia bacterium]|nr:energy-coupling factor transporter transmembrane protein EcfT [Clostridia bacterium]
MSFLERKEHINPLIALLCGVMILVVGLVFARTYAVSYFLIGAYILLIAFGYYKSCLRIIPAFIVLSAIFFVAFYYGKNSLLAGVTMVNRLAAIFIGLIPGMNIEPICLTRSLNQLKTPRAITLGMLITISFMPLLREEINRIREAMKTRGAGNILNPKVLYRAFIVPFIIRLVNISDTLALSIETRGFSLESNNATTYKKETINIVDVALVSLIVVGIVLLVVLK